MKKTVFDLDKKELKKVEKEFGKSYYVKNLKGFSYFITILLFFMIVGDIIFALLFPDEASIMNDTIFFIGLFLFIVLEHKRFILLKQFYDEKYVNNKKTLKENE